MTIREICSMIEKYGKLNYEQGVDTLAISEYTNPLAKKSCSSRLDERKKKLEKLLRDIKYILCPRHIHVAGAADECRECGLDLRDEIHLRMGEGYG